jgi:hypothetical protein
MAKLFGIDVDQIKAMGAQVHEFVTYGKNAMQVLGQNDVKIMQRIVRLEQKIDALMLQQGVVDVVLKPEPETIEHARINVGGI